MNMISAVDAFMAATRITDKQRNKMIVDDIISVTKKFIVEIYEDINHCTIYGTYDCVTFMKLGFALKYGDNDYKIIRNVIVPIIVERIGHVFTSQGYNVQCNDEILRLSWGTNKPDHPILNINDIDIVDYAIKQQNNILLDR